jgi:GntR family transcriptional regulator, transcriptional repressor for pyruvate dehydrogenase complex
MSALDGERDEGPGDSAAELVITLVRSQIERGLLRPGDRLPAERDLARRVGVSRPSVRAGLRTLSAMGVVQTRHGSGTYIRSGPPALDGSPLGMLAALHGFRPEQMNEARRVLETGVAGLAAERATPEHLAALAEEVTGMFAALENPDAFALHDVRFHRTLARASGNPLLASLVDMVTSLHLERRPRPLRTPEQLRLGAERHRNIYQAVRARDAERARHEVSQHLARPDRSRDSALAIAR